MSPLLKLCLVLFAIGIPGLFAVRPSDEVIQERKRITETKDQRFLQDSTAEFELSTNVRSISAHHMLRNVSATLEWVDGESVALEATPGPSDPWPDDISKTMWSHRGKSLSTVHNEIDAQIQVRFPAGLTGEGKVQFRGELEFPFVVEDMGPDKTGVYDVRSRTFSVERPVILVADETGLKPQLSVIEGFFAALLGLGGLIWTFLFWRWVIRKVVG